MKVMLTAALLGAVMTAENTSTQTVPPPLVAPTSGPVAYQPPNTNPIPPPPADGGKDGPYVSAIWAGIVARKHRLHHLRAEVRNEFGLWYVISYPFP